MDYRWDTETTGVEIPIRVCPACGQARMDYHQMCRPNYNATSRHRRPIVCGCSMRRKLAMSILGASPGRPENVMFRAADILSIAIHETRGVPGDGSDG